MRPCGVEARLVVMEHHPSAPLLDERRRALLDELARVDGELRTVREAKTDGTDDDEHDPEGATMSTQWSHATGLRSAVVLQLEEVDGALARIAAGTYGTCTRCGRPISAGRLEARPSAPLCIDCARGTTG
ncbi:DnaK suppressor protein [Sanguibacter keddieii DSM 10542]|uniref:DnaK suppressor protein n=2 Tax=Sanguibacter keddieii TaxID=60920 RepID=D1BG79_SANKS|nr:DnaK suppressor protein [Sanguibacter keddieii DSM 10542]